MVFRFLERLKTKIMVCVRSESTLQSTTLQIEQRAKLPTVFKSKRQPAVPTSEVIAWLHAEACSARSRKLLRTEVSNITHGEETYSKGIEILKVCELCLKKRFGQLFESNSKPLE